MKGMQMFLEVVCIRSERKFNGLKAQGLIVLLNDGGKTIINTVERTI